MQKSILMIVFVLISQLSKGQQLFTVNFENGLDSLIKIDTTFSENIWQIGTPHKIYLDSSWSLPNAIITDTVNYYPVNNYSTFTIKVYDSAWSYNFTIATNIQFVHKYQTDYQHDGGYIEVSYDGGTNWTNVFYDPQVNWLSSGTIYTDTIYNGQKAFTGESNWEFGGLAWCYGANSDTYLRFVFASDSIQNNKEGWLIDDISFITTICEGVPEVLDDDLISIYPNPASNEITIKRKQNSLNEQIQIFDFTGRLLIENNDFKGEGVNTSQLHDGFYLIKYSSGDMYCLKRFAVVH